MYEKANPKNTKDTKITMDDLAMMVQRGFMEMGGRIDELRTETNGKIDSLRAETRDGFARIENVLLRGHENRTAQEEEVVAISKQSQVTRAGIKEIPSLERQYGILNLMIPKGMFSRVGDYYFTEKSYSGKYI